MHKAARAPGTSYGIGQLAKPMSIVFMARHKVTSEHGTREQVTREQSMDTGPKVPRLTLLVRIMLHVPWWRDDLHWSESPAHGELRPIATVLKWIYLQNLDMLYLKQNNTAQIYLYL